MEVRQEQTATRPKPQPAPLPGARQENGARPSEQRSIPQLLRQLTDQVTTLFMKEMALARSEVRHAVSEAKVGVASVAAGGAVLFGGFLVLLFAAVAALALVVSTWLAALIVGGVTAIIGFIMLNVGKKKLEPSAFTPNRTAEQLRRDTAMAKSELGHGGSR